MFRRAIWFILLGHFIEAYPPQLDPWAPELAEARKAAELAEARKAAEFAKKLVPTRPAPPPPSPSQEEFRERQRSIRKVNNWLNDLPTSWEWGPQDTDDESSARDSWEGDSTASGMMDSESTVLNRISDNLRRENALRGAERKRPTVADLSPKKSVLSRIKNFFFKTG